MTRTAFTIEKIEIGVNMTRISFKTSKALYRRQYIKNWKLRDPEGYKAKVKQYCLNRKTSGAQAKYYEANKEKFRENMRKWIAKNRPRYNKYHRDYYAKHKAQIYANVRKWQLNNKEKWKAIQKAGDKRRYLERKAKYENK